MLLQEWRDVVFVHWPCEPGKLEAHIPPGLRLETWDDQAWLSLISFRIPRMRVPGFPTIPGIGSGTETHVRTYVRDPHDRGGIWLLSVDFDPALGAAMARVLFWLPYWWSTHAAETGERVRYSARRRWPGDHHVNLAVEPGEAIEPTGRDHFLTARWILFLRYGPILMAAEVEHPRWELRSARRKSLEETVTRHRGLAPPPPDPLMHFSPGVPARIGFPRPI
jgi:uncharacterized protein